MWKKIQALLDRIKSRLSLWAIIQGSGILSGGAVTGWLASAHDLIKPYGALGWWVAFLLGTFVTAVTFAAFAGLRYLWIRADVMREWRERVDDFNPLAPEFHTKRLRFADLNNPLIPTLADHFRVAV